MEFADDQVGFEKKDQVTTIVGVDEFASLLRNYLIKMPTGKETQEATAKRWWKTDIFD